MSGTSTRGATSTIDGTSSIDARRMGVTAATSLLTGLGEVVVRVGNDQLGPFLREVDNLSRQVDAARVAILAEALSRGVVATSDCATAAGWVIQWAPSFQAGGAGQLVKVAHATRSVRNLALAAAVLGGPGFGPQRRSGLGRDGQAAPTTAR